MQPGVLQHACGPMMRCCIWIVAVGKSLAPRLRNRTALGDTAPAPRPLPPTAPAATRAPLTSQHRQGTGAAAATAHRQVAPKPPTSTTVPKTDEDIQRMAKMLKDAQKAPENLPPPKLTASLSLPSTGMGAARRAVPAASARVMPDLSAVSSESIFLRGLLAANPKDIRRCASTPFFSLSSD